RNTRSPGDGVTGSSSHVHRPRRLAADTPSPPPPSPHHPVTPSPRYSITPSLHYPITPSPHHPITPSPHHPIPITTVSISWRATRRRRGRPAKRSRARALRQERRALETAGRGCRRRR